MHRHNKFFDIGDFAQDCKDNVIPQYTFLEPIFDGPHANSQHPDFAGDKGEALIGQVYNAIRNSPLWEDTLLLIVYDEHGGLYDHVYPPVLTNKTSLPDLPPTKDFGFKFDRLGVRVPAVFVSPWLKAGTILSQPFDHCSIVKTVREMFCLDKTPFNWREAQAESFKDIANLDVMRQDKHDLPNVVISDGNTPLKANRVALLPMEHRGALPSATEAIASPEVLAQKTRTADLPPVMPPDIRKPTDLVMLMAKAMEHSLGLAGVKLSKNTHQIYSAEDADAFLKEAQQAALSRGGQ
jgi:phospholipase C